MHRIRAATLIWTLGTFGLAAARGLRVDPGNISDVALTPQNTVNTTWGAINAAPDTHDDATSGLQLSFVNNLPSNTTTTTHAYVTGLDPNGKIVLLRPNGTWCFATVDVSITTPQPVTADVKIPLSGNGGVTNITLPDHISSARIWFAEGELDFFTVPGPGGNVSLVEPSASNPSDPAADVHWGFVEFVDMAQGGVWADISYVDFVGLPLGMTLTAMNGTTQSALGLPANAVESICDDLRAQAAVDGQPWDQLCLTASSGEAIRVLAPPDYLGSSTSGSPFHTYWDAYVDNVWAQFASNASTLAIDTQTAAGVVQCQVSNGNDTLTCSGDNRPYSKPSSTDIFGCNSGAFAITDTDNDVHRAVVPRLCAAFNRSTLLATTNSTSSTGRSVEVQPTASTAQNPYYAPPVTNFYSKFVHEKEIDGKGYAFSYDDVLPTGGVNPSGMLQESAPRLLTVIVGGPAKGNP